MSVAGVLELGIVLAKRNPEAGSDMVYDFIASLRVEQVAVSAEQVALAMEAYLRFGKGRHPAKLNFGDCFSYALAKSLNLPLLFEGEDFVLTDIHVAP